MTIFNSHTGFQIKITSVTDNTRSFQTKQNVFKRIENISYLAAPPDNSVLVSYVGSKPITPNNILEIADRSDSLYENMNVSLSREIIVTDLYRNIPLVSLQFIVTQKFYESINEKIPLFYKHRLPLTTVIDSVKVYDKNSNEVSRSHYLLEAEYSYSSTGEQESVIGYLLFNDLENVANLDTGEYETYFIQYIDGSTNKNELLNNELAYQEATYEDIWWDVTLDLKPWSYAYLVNKELYTVTLPGNGPIGIKYIDQRRLSIQSPKSIDKNSPWFPRIINGSILTSFGGRNYKYYLPEFINQSFNPIQPYKLAAYAKCTLVDDHIFKLPNNKIKLGTLFSPILVLIKENNTLQYALTNDTSLVGTKVADFETTDVTWSSSELLGYDCFSGIVYVSIPLNDEQEIFATYSYEEEFYDFTSLNMNPIFDSSAVEEIRTIFMIPENSINENLGTITQALAWVKSSKNGTITDLNVNDLNLRQSVSVMNSAGAPGYKLSGAIGMHYSRRATAEVTTSTMVLPGATIFVDSTIPFPETGWIRILSSSDKYVYCKYSSKTSGAFIISSVLGEYPDSVCDIDSESTIELVNFIDEYTTLTNREYTTELSHYVGPDNTYPRIYHRFFILGEISLTPPHRINECVSLDVRVNGGGIKPNKYLEAIEKNPKAQWIQDVSNYDGQVYPGDAVIVIKLPYTLKETFTDNQISDFVESNIPMGSKAIIRYYGYRPEITNISKTSDSITVEWKSLGSDFTYDVWYCKDSAERRWNQANTIAIVDSGLETTEYTIDTNIEQNTNYAIKVTCTDLYSV